MATKNEVFDLVSSGTDLADSLEQFTHHKTLDKRRNLTGIVGGIIDQYPFIRWARCHKPVYLDELERVYRNVMSAVKERDEVIGVESQIGLQQKTEKLYACVRILVQTIRRDIKSIDITGGENSQRKINRFSIANRQKNEPKELEKIYTEIQKKCRTVQVSMKMIKKILAVLLKSDYDTKTLKSKTGYEGGTLRSAVSALSTIEVITRKNGLLSITPKYKNILSNCLIDK